MMKWRLLGLLITILVAGMVIFFKFNQIPSLTFFDEVEFARLVLSLDGQAYTPYSSYSTGHSTLYFYFLLASLKLMGITSFALRLPSAIFAFLSVAVFYFISLSIFSNLHKNKASTKTVFFGTVASLILATSRWFFNFARYSFEATFLIFLELTSVLFFFRFVRSRKTLDIVLCALFAGLSYNSYAPGRIFFLLIIVSLFLSIRNRLLFLTKIQAVMAFSVFALAVLPLTKHLITHPDIRFNQQFYLKNEELTLGEKAGFMAENIRRNTLMFVTMGDMNGRHNYPGKPAVNPILALLFTAGLIRAVINRKNFFNQFFLLYMAIALLPTMFTYPWENPNMLRTVTALPAIAYLSTYAIEWLIWKGNTILRRKYLVATFLFIALTILTSAIYELRTYFKYHQGVFTQEVLAVKDISKADLRLREESKGP